MIYLDKPPLFEDVVAAVAAVAANGNEKIQKNIACMYFPS
jgi:hypothetical protein